MENPIIILTAEQWQKHIAELEEIKRYIAETMKKPQDLYLTHEQMLEFFKISDSTARRWKDEGKLGFSQVSKKNFMYKWSDLELLIERNYKKPFALKKPA